jgi:glycosyltransferase involved in cell wall biosynthesis
VRILQINAVANSGSTGRIAEEIGNVLLEQGHESYIAYGRNQATSSSKLIKIGTKRDVYLHGAYTLLTDKHAFASKKATKELFKEIDAIKPDLIALHNLHGYYINIEILFKYIKAKNIPIVWTLFDCWAFTGHCTYFDDIDCRKWETHCHKCPKYDKYPKSLVDNSFLNFKNKKELFTSVDNMQIITHSKWLSGLVKKSFLSNYKTHVTPSAINLDLFKPMESDLKTKFNIDDKKVILGCASVWSERKGLNDFLKLNKLIDTNYQIVLIGLSKKQLNQLPKGIIGLNRTESIKELAEWYSVASVFVNPTTQDNFPTTNIEALACGTPVITYNTGGSPEAIDQETGEVVDKGNVDGILKAIKSLEAKDQVLLSDNCVKRAEKRFDKKYRYLDYLNIFEKLIKN